MYTSKKNPVPVIMYHSVGIPKKDWIWNHLTIDYKIFEKQMATLKALGFNTISLNELYQYMDGGKEVPKKSFVLTFDDGYVDNWIAVAPILKKYQFKGTVYVNPEFVDPRENCRKSLNDVWKGNVNEDELEWNGFLSWAEMKELEKEGILDIQSHSMTHTWYFSDSKIIDFRHPGDEYVWLDWNACPETKYKYIKDSGRVNSNLGEPVYEYGKSLEVRRYLPNEKIKKYLVDYVCSLGGSEFFKRADWRDCLFSKYAEIYEKYEKGIYENDNELCLRVDYELKKAKEIIEEKLKKKVSFLCWPGGGYNEDVKIKARLIYKSMTISSDDYKNKKNVPGDDPSTIKRIGVPYILKGDGWGGIRYLGGYSLYLSLGAFNGSLICKIQKKIIIKTFGMLAKLNII